MILALLFLLLLFPKNVFCEEAYISEIYTSELKDDDFTIVFRISVSVSQESENLTTIFLNVEDEDNVFRISLENLSFSKDTVFSVKMSDYDIPIKSNHTYAIKFVFSTSSNSLYHNKTIYTITTPPASHSFEKAERYSGLYPSINSSFINTTNGIRLFYSIEEGSLKTTGYGYLLYQDGEYLGSLYKGNVNSYDSLEISFNLYDKFGVLKKGNYEAKPYVIANENIVCYGRKISFVVGSDSYLDAKLKQFLNDSRWRDGADWSDPFDPDGRRSYLNPEHRSWACCAAVDDLTFYVFGQFNYDGTKTFDIRNLSRFDSVYLEHTNEDGSITPHHLVILDVLSDGCLYTFDANSKRTYVSTDRWTVDYQKGVFYLHKEAYVMEWEFIYCRHHPN